MLILDQTTLLVIQSWHSIFVNVFREFISKFMYLITY